MSYPLAMGARKGIKLPEDVARQLRQQARQSGRSVAALVRELVEAPPLEGGSVYALGAGLAGSLAGSRRSATNARGRFRRS
ncbi:MAG: ribbon-helix-helix protein, CopG family [Bryobacterales bacterium]|nr:ribbon-helix-helix protein, CopG family [Bryobacterales bacterium]